ncbi:hypothetical protein HOD38_05100 [archaeon]|jgi:hypothetical protein|nr:hypothetical protein [archaeon]MBT4397617.1 hypothetical protein [archaeon]MBT4441084.1 hypothetical protein [archaeon]
MYVNYDDASDLLEEMAYHNRRKNKMKQQTIDFSLFESKYIKIELEEPKTLTINGWEIATATFDQTEVPAIRFVIIEEDGRAVEKEWVVSSKRLISELQHHMETCKQQDKEQFRVRIFRTGTGKNTRYSVKEI